MRPALIDADQQAFAVDIVGSKVRDLRHRHPAPYATPAPTRYLMPGAASSSCATFSTLNKSGSFPGRGPRTSLRYRSANRALLRTGSAAPTLCIDDLLPHTMLARVQLEAPYILGDRVLRRAGQASRERGGHSRAGYATALADRHVVEHRLTQRRNGVFGGQRRHGSSFRWRNSIVCYGPRLAKPQRECATSTPTRLPRKCSRALGRPVLANCKDFAQSRAVTWQRCS